MNRGKETELQTGGNLIAQPPNEIENGDGGPNQGGSRRIEADMKDKQGLNVMDGLQAQ